MTRKQSWATPADFFSKQVSSAQRFYLGLNPLANHDLIVVCGGVEHCTPDYAIHRSSSPFYTIEYVVRGQGEFKFKGHRHIIKPGSIFTYGPGAPHDITTDSSAPLVKYFVDFVGAGAPQLLDTCELSAGQMLQIFPPNEVQGIFDELIRSGGRPSLHIHELCAALLKCIALKIADSHEPVDGMGTLSFTTFKKCQEIIQEHFLQFKTLEQMASRCGIHEVYLCRLFQRYDHQSPYQYLLRLKMNQAAQWLQQPGALVKEVATQVGFDDPFHFSRAFKAILGFSPKTFRHLR